MAATAYCLENPSGSDEALTGLDIGISRNTKNFWYSDKRNCSDGVIVATASYNNNPQMTLYVNPKTGHRSCNGDGCKDIGFTKRSTDAAICTFNECGTAPMIANCGANTVSGCYYAD